MEAFCGLQASAPILAVWKYPVKGNPILSEICPGSLGCFLSDKVLRLLQDSFPSPASSPIWVWFILPINIISLYAHICCCILYYNSCSHIGISEDVLFACRCYSLPLIYEPLKSRGHVTYLFASHCIWQWALLIVGVPKVLVETNQISWCSEAMLHRPLWSKSEDKLLTSLCLASLVPWV